jgi:hypothetical protein
LSYTSAGNEAAGASNAVNLDAPELFAYDQAVRHTDNTEPAMPLNQSKESGMLLNHLYTTGSIADRLLQASHDAAEHPSSLSGVSDSAAARLEQDLDRITDPAILAKATKDQQGVYLVVSVALVTEI